MATEHREVPEWLVERLVANDLPEHRSKEVSARLQEFGEAHRVAKISASNSEILAELPPARVVPEIQRRLAIRERHNSSRRARPIWALSALATCATGLVAVMLWRHPSGPVELPVSPSEQIRVKGLNPQIHIYRKTVTGSELLAAGMQVHKGDTLQIRYLAAGQRFGMIASIDGRGSMTLHLPESPGEAAQLEPSGERAMAHSFELDDSPGFERFIFVSGNSSFTTADVARTLISGAALPKELLKYEITLRKEKL